MSDLAIGIDFAGCRVEELIGRGGMGVVYRGTDLRLDRPVAIKLIATEYATDAAIRRRFKREARLMASIDHPNVIPVYAAGEQDSHLYLVMRYVAGTDLHRRLADHERLSAQEAARIVNDLAGALDAAHAAGLVHRDIKPANVLMAGSHVYLTDFGITRAVDSGTRFTDSDEWVGTVDYMSPEHLRGGVTDARSDVYSLGCLLYAALTGSPPFRRATAAATILAHIEDKPPRPSATAAVPRAFDPVVARALAKRPADRYPSAGELGAAALAAVRGAAPAVRDGAPAVRDGAPAVRDGAPAVRDGAPAVRDGAPAVRDGAPAVRDGAPAGATSKTAVRAPRTARTSRLRFYADRRRARIAAACLAALLVAGVVALAAVVLSSGTSTATGPLSAAEVLGAARGFASAYSARDSRALARVLSSDVTRISTTAIEHGRAAVLAEYKQQFRSDPTIRAYELQGPEVTVGNVGRVAAHYTVLLGAHGTITGRVVFGVKRVDGRAVIGLITTQQSG